MELRSAWGYLLSDCSKLGKTNRAIMASPTTIVDQMIVFRLGEDMVWVGFLVR